MKKLLSVFTILLLMVFLASCKKSDPLSTMDIDSNDSINITEFNAYLSNLKQGLTDGFKEVSIDKPSGSEINRNQLETSLNATTVRTKLYFDSLIKYMDDQMVDIFLLGDQIDISNEFEIGDVTIKVEYDGTSFRMTQVCSTDYYQFFITTTAEGLVYCEYFSYYNITKYYDLIQYLEGSYYKESQINNDDFETSYRDTQNDTVVFERYYNYLSEDYDRHVKYYSNEVNFDISFTKDTMTYLSIYQQNLNGYRQLSYLEQSDRPNQLAFNVLLLSDWDQLIQVNGLGFSYAFYNQGQAIHTEYPYLVMNSGFYQMYTLEDVTLNLPTIFIDDQLVDITILLATYTNLKTDYDSYVDTLEFLNEILEYQAYLEYFNQYPKIIDKIF